MKIIAINTRKLFFNSYYLITLKIMHAKLICIESVNRDKRR